MAVVTHLAGKGAGAQLKVGAGPLGDSRFSARRFGTFADAFAMVFHQGERRVGEFLARITSAWIVAFSLFRYRSLSLFPARDLLAAVPFLLGG
ncbi:hypothetical protein [uncultured Pseudomonas sp.]|uniref:hypothetical protein n=1 Tax=uncultured Pseudomonas sp. TaxID=114707 RepID=UPI00258AD3C6|nr:hypothetical protein [uncultured Pseudomonas sp.]